MTAEEVTRIRKKLGVAQESMARLLNVSTITVNRWENGHFVAAAIAEDYYSAFKTALENGHKADKILSRSHEARGVFLLHLFSLAYGRKSK